MILIFDFENVPTVWYLRNNSTVFEELEVSIVDVKVANAVSNPQLTLTTRQIQYCYSYSDEILPTCTH